MAELMDGSGVFWNAFRNWASHINAATDIYFTQETPASCCPVGIQNKSKSGHPPLKPLIIQALIGR